MNIDRNTAAYTQGIATLLLVVVFVAGTTALVLSLTALSITETRSARDTTHSIRSFFSSESILEDVALRTLDDDVSNNIVDTNAYDIYFDHDSINADVELRRDEEAGTERYTAGSALDSATRNSSFRLIPRNQGSWSTDLQAGWLGIRLFNTASVKGQIFSNGPIRGLSPTKNMVSIRPGKYVHIAPPRTGADVGGSNNTTPINYIVFRDHEKKDNIVQQFATSNTGYLTKMRVKIARTAYTTSWGDLVFRVRPNTQVNGKYVPDTSQTLGNPITVSGSNISVAFPVFSSAANIPWFELDFSSQYIPIRAGQPYWLEMHAEGCSGDCARYFYVAAQEGGAAQYPTIDAYDAVLGGKRPMVLWSQNNDGSEWCEPNSVGSFVSYPCTLLNNQGYWSPTAGPSDIIFETHVSTSPTVIDNVIINTCADGAGAGTCDGAPLYTCGVYAEAPKITNSTIYAQTNTSGGAVTVQPPCTSVSSYPTSIVPGSTQPITATSAPFSISTINNWKKAAGWNADNPSLSLYCGTDEGCTGADGPLNVTASTVTFPKTTGDIARAVINGNFTIGNDPITIRSPYVYVRGNLTAGSGANCIIQASSAQIPEDTSIVIIVEGTVSINNCNTTGRPGDPESHVMIVSLSKNIEDGSPAIHLQNSALADLMYAHYGLVRLNNSASAQAVYGEGILMEQSTETQSIYEGVGALQFADTGTPDAQGEVDPKGWGEQ